MEKKKHRKLTIIGKVLLTVLAVFIVCIIANKWKITITPAAGTEEHVELGDTYQETGASADMTGTIFRFIHKTLDVTASGSVDGKKAGTYTITYTAQNGKQTETLTKTVIVSDTQGTVITLKSDPDGYTPYGHPYQEEGYTAIDATDGDVTDKVTSEEKDGKVYYKVSDSLGNTSEAVREIHYDDRLGPEINLNGDSEVTWYTDQGNYTETVTAADDVDGEVAVQTEGSVDSSAPNDYTLTYTSTDAHGNTTTAQRIVHVRIRPVNVERDGYDAKTIYLTFDDGPGPYTDQLLDILDKYNVKATFFTTGVRPQYSYCIQNEAARGHSVYVHSATHNYGQIYSSTDAYWADFNAQNALIQQLTGSAVNIFRFPGGSSNTVSANYCTGIMGQLTEQASAKGLIYEDWNVSSGDAGGTTSTDQVYANVIQQVSANTSYGVPSVVLQHDIKDFSVNAVEKIILWGIDNGYSFKRITAGSYVAHHHVNN